MDVNAEELTCIIDSVGREGRYKISPIDTDAYLLPCCRYVELNPVKAGMVNKPESYEWSSYSSRVGVSHFHWLDVPETFLALASSHPMGVEAYRQFVEQDNAAQSGELIRAAINSNKLTGGNKFVDEKNVSVSESKFVSPAG